MFDNASGTSDALKAYQRHGVREYVVWRTYDQAIDWFVHEAEAFVPMAPDAGIYRSRVFPGLWLDAPALLAGDFARVTAIAREGQATPDHRGFVERLRSVVD